MTQGFVFGKFLPFHLGHKALIEFGASKCDELIIIVCASSLEKIPGKDRLIWISSAFQENNSIQVINFEYDESILPNTSASSMEVSKIWADEFSKIVPNACMLFTSEPYGEYVATCMGINHICYDQARKNFPVSGTMLRRSLLDNWDLLPKNVKAYFQKKIVILGTESSGKSTLANYLYSQFRSFLVYEIGREVIPDSNKFTREQLLTVAQGHSQKINQAINTLEPLIIIDTDIHITQSYAKYFFGEYLDLSQQIYASNKANLYFYLNREVPYIQDGTRLNENIRNQLDQSHKLALDHFGIDFVELSGSYSERESKCSLLIKDLFKIE